MKSQNSLFFKNYNSLWTANFNALYPQNYTLILDTFRPDYNELVLYTDYIRQSTPLTYLTDLDFSLTRQNEIYFSNPLKLRTTAKNSIVTYNAIQKVFKSRFDEGRSNARLQDISNSAVNYMFVNSTKIPYESLLGKNKDSFFSPASYNQTVFVPFTELTGLYNTFNTHFSDLPFLVANYSDSARHLWFD